MNRDNPLRRHLSPLGAWAFSIGTSVGWGALVVTANTFLAQGGPMGSALGLVIGALIMGVVSWNYSYLMRCYPEAGGAYAYTREVFGYDYGFMTAWFLAMTYLAVLWANATSLPLFCRIFLGDVFRFGRLYTLFGYDVYLGEALLSVCALGLFGFLCTRRARTSDALMIALALVFTAGIAVCSVGALAGKGLAFRPAYLPNKSAIAQVFRIAVISPWAFIGFENISHATEEFDFDRRWIRRVLMISVVATLALYVLVTFLSVSAYPPRYESWLDYIRDLDNLEGLEALPAFYAANRCLGGFGVGLLTASLFSLVITSLIGNTTALSRLFYAMAKDRIFPGRFAEVDSRGVPSKAVLLVVGFSALVPLLGRTAVGWIVDVTTIGGTLIYLLVSASAARLARNMGDRREMWIGRAGMAIMAAFGLVVLLPNLVSRGSMSRATYLLFIAWSVCGFIFFRYTLHRDRQRRFGSTIIVWVALLGLVLVIALIWMRQSMIASNDALRSSIRDYYAQVDDPGGLRLADAQFIEAQLNRFEMQDAHTILLAMGMFAFAVVIMLTNHSYMIKRSEESEQLANADPLTGVRSKRAFLLRKQEIDAGIARNRCEQFALVVCDLNGLKKINDTLGHKAGDDYIREASRMVCEIFRHSPVYRVGGDEFVAILHGRDYDSRDNLALALHDLSVEHLKTGGAVVAGGLADYISGQDKNLHDVFERADAQMYEEKQLLKGMGAATRDDQEEPLIAPEQGDEPSILAIKKRVLIVDDEPIDQMLLGNALKEEYDVMYASDGIEAMDQACRHRDDLALIMLNLQMPRMGGKEVLRSLKSDDDLKDIPVIVLTSDPTAEVECLRIGAADFVPKPYPDWEIILARVERCIETTENRNIIRSTERDSLTRLFNNDYFLRYVKMYDRHYRDMSMDAIVIDVNHFHMLKERYGKAYGDGVLRRVGDSIRRVSREVGGVGCRWGVDTFLIYCPHQEDYEAMLAQVSAGFAEDEASANRVRLRMGVYAKVDKALDIERRFEYARAAADSVRNTYDSAVGFYDAGMRDKELFRERLLEDFRPALENRRFKVYYQPKFDIRQDAPLLASAEALVRWDHPELGMLGPNIFIPLLEENGLILELDKYVWREAAARIRDWKDRIGYSVPVSVNVSRIDMLTPNLKTIFTEILDTYRLGPGDLMLEITESAYTGDSEQVISTAHELRGMGMGFRIEMDDFGSGYSSLGMLANLPIDALKLDISFIHSAFGETRDVRMIELIIDIADYLHVPVVAEGVETEEQYLVLKSMGCDLVQGFYFSKPVPPEQFDRFLIERGSGEAAAVPSILSTGMTLSDALNGRFENIYYVDVATHFYLEFKFGSGGALEICPGGSDFFGQACPQLLEGVRDEDAGALAQALTPENLARWIGQENGAALSFQKTVDGQPRRYALQTIRTRASDDSHVVIGIRPED